MDLNDRIMIRSASEWRAKLRVRGLRLICPGCGENRIRGLEVHHVSGVKFGEEAVLLCVICHREVTDWQMTEHPPILEGPPTQEEKEGRFLLGLADVYDVRTNRMRIIGEARIAKGQGRSPK